MGYRYEQTDYCVSVDGAFVTPRLWLIHAAIGFRKDLGIAARERLGPEVDLEMTRAIAREARFAWSLGAEEVRLVVDGHDDLDRFFEVLPENPAAGRALRPAPSRVASVSPWGRPRATSGPRPFGFLRGPSIAR